MFGLCVRGRDRQTDRQGESVAESSSEIQARCSHRNTLCSAVMAPSSTAHSFSLWEPEYFGDILGLCLCASAQGVPRHNFHLPVVNTRVATSTEIPPCCHGAAQRKAGVEPWAFPKGQQSKGRAGGAGREGRSHLTTTQKCLFPSGSRTVLWKEPPVQAESGHRVFSVGLGLGLISADLRPCCWVMCSPQCQNQLWRDLPD